MQGKDGYLFKNREASCYSSKWDDDEESSDDESSEEETDDDSDEESDEDDEDEEVKELSEWDKAFEKLIEEHKPALLKNFSGEDPNALNEDDAKIEKLKKKGSRKSKKEK